MLIKRPKHIFIVEDNEIYAMLLDYILSKDSIYQFVRFKSGEECLANLYLNPDVIILDYGLPGINGYDTLFQIKKHNPKIHVVILTVSNDANLAAELLKAGADDFILKEDHGEGKIVRKIDEILTRDEIEKNKLWGLKNRSFIQRMLYFMLVVILITIVFFFYSMM